MFILGNFSQIQILAICSQFQVLIGIFVVFTVQNNSLFSSVILLQKVEKNSKLHNFQSVEHNVWDFTFCNKLNIVSRISKSKKQFKISKFWANILKLLKSLKSLRLFFFKRRLFLGNERLLPQKGQSLRNCLLFLSAWVYKQGL